MEPLVATLASQGAPVLLAHQTRSELTDRLFFALASKSFEASRIGWSGLSATPAIGFWLLLPRRLRPESEGGSGIEEETAGTAVV